MELGMIVALFIGFLIIWQIQTWWPEKTETLDSTKKNDPKTDWPDKWKDLYESISSVEWDAEHKGSIHWGRVYFDEKLTFFTKDRSVKMEYVESYSEFHLSQKKDGKYEKIFSFKSNDNPLALFFNPKIEEIKSQIESDHMEKIKAERDLANQKEQDLINSDVFKTGKDKQNLKQKVEKL